MDAAGGLKKIRGLTGPAALGLFTACWAVMLKPTAFARDSRDLSREYLSRRRMGRKIPNKITVVSTKHGTSPVPSIIWILIRLLRVY